MVNNKQSFLYLSLSFLLLGISFSSCQKKTSEEKEIHYTLDGDTIILTQASNIATRLKLLKITTGQFSTEISTAGVVKAIPNQYAEIASPFAGRVLKSFIRLGQNVSPGTPIFEISSPDYFNAQKEFFDAQQELKQTELNLNRQRDLLENGVGIQRELEEAETAYNTKKSALSNASAALKIFNADPTETVLGQPLIVRSPIQGEVIGNNIVIGQYLKEDAAPIAIVAELTKVWIAGEVKEKDINLIHSLDEVEVTAAAFPDKIIKGKLYHISKIVDEDTRSVQVLVECDNEDKGLKPGMYITVRFIGAPKASILIPTKAVLQMDEQTFVFVQTDKNKYIKRVIEGEAIANGETWVKSGLKAGETIVQEGGIFLLEAK